jgi:hypothetical protein
MSLHIFAIDLKLELVMKHKKSDFDILGSFEGFEEIYKVTSLEAGKGVSRTPLNVKAAVEKLQEIARKHRLGLEELEDAALEVKQEWIISEPSVYVARTRDSKTDKEYFTAKTFWPLKGGKKKEVKIYLGKAEDFGNDTMSIRARETAKRKMSETLRRRKDSGEI